MFRGIGLKIIAAVGLAVSLGLIATALFYERSEARAILEQNRRTLHAMTESAIRGIESLMVEGYAEVLPAYQKRLKSLPDALDFRILRVDGNEAFRDNATLHTVNQRLKREAFVPRPSEESVPVLSPDHPEFLRALKGEEAVFSYHSDAAGHPLLTFFDPIFNDRPCHRCHGGEARVLAVIKLTTSMVPLQNEILKSRQYALLVTGVALIATMLLTGYMIGRSIVKPIQNLTDAMTRVSTGDLEHKVPVAAQDELGRMGQSFNAMTTELKRGYDSLRGEREKLTTLIEGAQEAIVVTDASGEVVLVNPAAEQLLGKPAEAIRREGFLSLLDNPAQMRGWLAGAGRAGAEIVPFHGRFFQVAASSIYDHGRRLIGSAALLRDVTEEKRLEEELRKLSTTDPLTGLFNRRHLDATLEHEIERAKRYALPLSVLMCDIDHFKRFNDEHGHEMGDRILVGVARILRGALRNHDTPCRFGGEEFLAILPSTSQAGAYAVAERLRRDIEEAELEGLRVTVSVGVASFPDMPAARAEQLAEAADRALYEAKNAGRNRVRVAAS